MPEPRRPDNQTAADGIRTAVTAGGPGPGRFATSPPIVCTDELRAQLGADRRLTR